MSVTKFVFLPPTLQELHFTFFSFDSKLNTFPIWCLSLQHPSPCSYVSERRKEGCRATKLSDSVSGLLMPVYDCLWSNARGRNQVPTIFVFHHWPLAASPCLIYSPRLLMEWGHSSWSMSLLCFNLCWLSKPPFYFLQTLSLYVFLFCFCIQLWWAEKAKSLASRKNPMDRRAWSQRVRHNWSDLAQAQFYLVAVLVG